MGKELGKAYGEVKLVEIANFTLGFEDVQKSEELSARGVVLNPALDGELGEVSFGVFFDIPKVSGVNCNIFLFFILCNFKYVFNNFCQNYCFLLLL